MLAVSDEYKQAIKNEVREFKAQVEIFIDGAGYMFKTQSKIEEANLAYSGDIESISNCNSVFDNKNTYNNYASLEQDYTQLDGTYILPNRSNANEYSGYIGNIGTSEFIITGGTTYQEIGLGKYIPLYGGVSGKKITLFFEEGYPTNFSISCKPLLVNNMHGDIDILDERSQTYEATSKILTLDLPIDDSEVPSGWSLKGLQQLKITINQWSEPNKRVRIRHINNGTTILFEGNEIVDIKLIEQTDIFNENIPSNDLTLTINNYDKKFNLLDIDNIYNSLNKNDYIVPTIGINTNNGYEYLCLGRYNFKSYENTKDLLTKINCYGAVECILDTNYQYISNTTSSSTSSALSYLGVYRFNATDKTINFSSSNYNSYREQAQALSIASQGFVKQEKDVEKWTSIATRYDYSDNISVFIDNSLTLDTINTNNIREITNDIEISNPEIKKRNQLRGIKFNYLRNLGEKTGTDKWITIFDDTVYNDNYNQQYERWESTIDIKSSTPHTNSIYNVRAYFDGTEHSLAGFGTSINDYELKFTNIAPDNGEHVKIDAIDCTSSELTNTIFNINVDSGSVIEYNNNFIVDKLSQKDIANYIFSIDKEYEFSLEILGDLSLEVGDIIYFSTPYYKNMYGIIQEIETTFNGGLTQRIKGVCSNVLQ